MLTWPAQRSRRHPGVVAVLDEKIRATVGVSWNSVGVGAVADPKKSGLIGLTGATLGHGGIG